MKIVYIGKKVFDDGDLRYVKILDLETMKETHYLQTEEKVREWAKKYEYAIGYTLYYDTDLKSKDEK